MVAIRPAGPRDVDAICNFLHTHMDRRMGIGRWRALMSYGWKSAKPTLGWLVEESGQIVGYIGLIYADRTIDGRSESLVNLTSWYLLRPYRGLETALAMLNAATADAGATYTVFSSRPAVTRLMRRAGFRCLDHSRFVWHRSGTPSGGLQVLTEPAAIGPHLSPIDRRILDDHGSFDTAPYLLRDADGETCFMLLSIRAKGADIAYHEALYISDPALFARHAQTFADMILPPEKALVAVDCRFLDGQAAATETEAIPAPRFFKSARLSPSQVDFLYSEIQLLNLKLD